MATDLHDRLSDLAGHTPPASPPTDLWDRGVRRRRLARAGQAAIAAVLVLVVALGGWTWHQSRPIPPADTHGDAQVPDRLYQPSPWLPAFNGPTGPLISVIPTVRNTFWHQENGYVGVTADSGRYGFLRLPGVVDNIFSTEGVSLSPDGRMLATWVTGETEEKPHGASPVVGIDVRDLVTGAVYRWRPGTAHGLSTETLVWAAPTRSSSPPVSGPTAAPRRTASPPGMPTTAGTSPRAGPSDSPGR
jgi:hypothetical protein